MALSKKSLNFFANQYNVAVITKAVYFRVDNTLMNRQVLSLLYKEGLISSYSFNFDDVFLKEGVDKSTQVLPYTRKIQRTVDPRLYFFNMTAVAEVQRNLLPTKVINDEAQQPEDMFSIISLNSFDFRREDDLILFVYKLLDIFYTLKKKVKSEAAVLISNKEYSFWFEQVSSVVTEEQLTWAAFFKTLLQLKRCHELELMDHDPVVLIFSSSFEFKLLEYMDYLYCIDLPYKDAEITTRAEMQLTLSQDSWKYQDVIFTDDRIFVFPKYVSGIPVLKKLKTCGGNVVKKYVSFAELTLLKQEKGYTTLYLVSTDGGLLLDSINNLLFQKGGLLLLSLKI